MTRTVAVVVVVVQSKHTCALLGCRAGIPLGPAPPSVAEQFHPSTDIEVVLVAARPHSARLVEESVTVCMRVATPPAVFARGGHMVRPKCRFYSCLL